MSDAFQKELRKFDAERILPAWEGLVRGQQARLEALKVPTMFVTSDPSDMEVRTSRLHVKCNPGVLPHATRPLCPEAASGGERPRRYLAHEWSRLESDRSPCSHGGAGFLRLLYFLPRCDYQGANVSQGTRPQSGRRCLSACFICCDGYKGTAVMRVAGGLFPSHSAALPLSPKAT